MIEVKNLLFQPLTLHLAGGKGGLHLNPRERRRIEKTLVSQEIELAAKRGFIAVTEVEDTPEPSAPAEAPASPPVEEPLPASASASKPKRRSSKTSG